MSPYAAYQRQTTLGWTRIDALLALLDAAVARTELVLAAMGAPGEENLRHLRARAQLAVLGLWVGVNTDGEGTATNLVRLYRFAADALANGGPDEVRGALQTLCTLREGFEGIRAEATELERNGLIPPIDASCAVHALG